MKVSRFNVRTKDEQGYTHNVDVSPLDLSILQEGYTLRYGDQPSFDKALDRLVSDLHQFSKDAEPYEYKDQGPDYEAQIKATRDQLSRGETASVKAYLEEFLSEYSLCKELMPKVKACCLLARVKNLDGLERYRKPTLNQQMESAESRKAAPTHDTPSPEKER